MSVNLDVVLRVITDGLLTMHAFRVSGAECTRPQTPSISTDMWAGTDRMRSLASQVAVGGFQLTQHPWMHSGLQPPSQQTRMKPILAVLSGAFQEPQ